MPLSFVTAVRVTPVFTSVIVTFAFGTDAPLTSVIVPTNEPVTA